MIFSIHSLSGWEIEPDVLFRSFADPWDGEILLTKQVPLGIASLHLPFARASPRPARRGHLRGVRSGHRSPLPRHPLASPTGLLGRSFRTPPRRLHPLLLALPARRREAASLRSLPTSHGVTMDRGIGVRDCITARWHRHNINRSYAAQSFWARSSLRDRAQNDCAAGWNDLTLGMDPGQLEIQK